MTPEIREASLTVVICTHDRCALLARVIGSLNAAQRPARLSVRLLVIANACSDDTQAWLTDYVQRTETGALPLHWLAEPAPGKSFALNRALQAIDSGFVAFVDDDHRVPDDYLSVIAEAIVAHPEASMLCGRIRPDWDSSEPAWVHDRGRYRIYPLPVPAFDLGDEPRRVTAADAIPGGGNLVVRRDVFERVGRFATELGPHGHDLGGSEDTDFVLRALDRGEHLQYLPAMVQYHHVDPERLRPGYLLRKSFQRSRSIIRVKCRGEARIPRYLWRQAANYLLGAVFCLGADRRRFYLVRLAGVAGEIQGRREARRLPTAAGNGHAKAPVDP